MEHEEAHEIARKIMHMEHEMDQVSHKQLYHVTILDEHGQEYAGVMRQLRLPGFMAIDLETGPIPDEVAADIERMEPHRPHYIAMGLDMKYPHILAKLYDASSIGPVSEEEAFAIMAYESSDGNHA
ncbi:MAG: hypothetical protein DRO99_02790 [Candidatus Aenigmatarchaeota archaeon]|nr:MAG: hypothetical protein DRO99_02790 [Candidatus Aenigmarchaeota archaeon]